jgi:hypothetical protein
MYTHAEEFTQRQFDKSEEVFCEKSSYQVGTQSVFKNKPAKNVEPTSSVHGFFPKRPFFETASLCFE